MRLTAVRPGIPIGSRPPDPQLDQLREYARARGLEIVEGYLDEGISGKKDRRPALARLMVDAHRHRFEVVAFVKLDRLGLYTTSWASSASWRL